MKGGVKEGKGSMGLYANPIPAGQAAAACIAFHSSASFLGWGGVTFLHSRGHQRCRTTSKATHSQGVDDCNPPLSPLLAASTP